MAIFAKFPEFHAGIHTDLCDFFQLYFFRKDYANMLSMLQTDIPRLKCSGCLVPVARADHGLLPSGRIDPLCSGCRASQGPPGKVRLTCSFCGTDFVRCRFQAKKDRRRGKPLGCGRCFSSRVGRGRRIRRLHTATGQWDGIDVSTVTAKECLGCGVVKLLCEYSTGEGGMLGYSPRCRSCIRETVSCARCGEPYERNRSRKASKTPVCIGCIVGDAAKRREQRRLNQERLYAQYRNKDGAEMIDINELVGQEFGALTALSEGPRVGKVGCRSLHCRCRCGKEVDVVLSHVTGGTRRDCGCKYDFDRIKQEAIIGKRFGKLVVLAVGLMRKPHDRDIKKGLRRRDKTRLRTMICRCDCGEETDIGFRSLLVGTSRSCGCARKKGQMGVPAGSRRCARCKEVKSESIFVMKVGIGSTALSSWCPICTRTYQMCQLAKKKYGMTKEEVMKLGRENDWSCAICRIKLQNREEIPILPRGLNNSYPCIDHEHVENPTKEHVRGILCTRCNSGLGFFKDSIERMNNAISYLESYAKRRSNKLL